MTRMAVASLLLGLLAASMPAAVHAADRVDRVHALRGAGTWIDVYDWSPSYSKRPPISAATMKSIAATGIKTVFIQGGRSERAAALDPERLKSLMAAARSNDLNVVLWYLPSYRNTSRDLNRIREMVSLDPDGIALDLESRTAPSRTQVLNLLKSARGLVDQPMPLTAVVYPPAGTKVTGRTTWDTFPWAEANAYVDVWAVMAYWREAKVFAPAAPDYLEASVSGLQSALPTGALIHVIGGVATKPAEAKVMSAFTANLRAIGASIYDWRSSSPAAHTELASGIYR